VLGQDFLRMIKVDVVCFGPSNNPDPKIGVI
jgi:hypothetical protein